MKILKSGIEMTPTELIRARGGACACGCSGGHNSGGGSWIGSEGGDCYCGCEFCSPPDADYQDFFGNWVDAWECLQ
jgi:hypothetical protein